MLLAVRTDYGRGEPNCPAYDLRIEMTLHNAWREEKGQVNAADNGHLYAASICTVALVRSVVLVHDITGGSGFLAGEVPRTRSQVKL